MLSYHTATAAGGRRTDDEAGSSLSSTFQAPPRARKTQDQPGAEGPGAGEVGSELSLQLGTEAPGRRPSAWKSETGRTILHPISNQESM